MLTIVAGLGTFLLLVLSLVALLMVARARLVQSGMVTILINDDPAKALTVPSGSTLLSTLADQQIFIPSACGGKGSCGVCKLEVHSGGGALLPTETGHVKPGEARRGVRLSCQVKVKEDMSIHVEDEVFGVRRWKCRVRSNDNVATFIKELVLELPQGETVPFRAGGYIQIECPPHVVKYSDFEVPAEYREDWENFGLFKLSSTTTEPVTRAYSMANYPLESDIIMLNVRIATPPPRTTGVPPG
jgi:Na+-transporting NADH:ubiquinone oxidoreductase subunit F